MRLQGIWLHRRFLFFFGYIGDIGFLTQNGPKPFLGVEI